MQLPDFIKRMLGFADKVEGHFVASEQLTEAHARVTKLEAELAGAAARATEAATRIASLSAEITAANLTVASSATRISALESEVETERQRANATIAGQGLAPDQVPASTPTPSTASKESAWEKYHRLMNENPMLGAKFWAEHKDDILTRKN